MAGGVKEEYTLEEKEDRSMIGPIQGQYNRSKTTRTNVRNHRLDQRQTR